jgi:hypothetical protein
MLITFTAEPPVSGGVRPEGSGVPAVSPACPICSGALVPVRGFARCSRCSFTLCQGCEGGQAGPELCETD